MRPEESHSLGLGYRLATPVSAALAESAFEHELDAARYLWPELSIADLAHAIVLDEAGLIPMKDRAELFSALRTLHSINLDELVLDPHLGDLYDNRDHILQQLAPSAAGFIHAGRARREATTVAWHLACRSRIQSLAVRLSELILTTTALCSQETGTLLPDFTYLHRAQPTSLAHYLLGHSAPFVRHLERLENVFAAVNSSPAGVGSTNGSRLAIDRIRLAELLGFDSIIRHTRDAMWPGDVALDIAFVSLQIMTSVDRLVEDLQIWSTESFGFVEIDDAQSRTSVIMPHKKNPYSLTYLRGLARHSLGVAVGINATLMTPTGQPDNRTFSYVEIPAILDRSIRGLKLLSDVVQGAKFDRELMFVAASDRYLLSTEICDLLSTKGIANRLSHKILGRVVRNAFVAGKAAFDYEDIVSVGREMGVRLPISQAEFEEVMNPNLLLFNRITLGGAGPQEVFETITEQQLAVKTVMERFGSRSIQETEDRLLGEIESRIVN